MDSERGKKQRQGKGFCQKEGERKERNLRYKYAAERKPS